jgi:hypothetical protein
MACAQPELSLRLGRPYSASRTKCPRRALKLLALATQLPGLRERVPDGERRTSPVAGVHRLLSAHHVDAVRHRVQPGIDCQGTMVLTVQGFDAGGGLVENVTAPVLVEGGTVRSASRPRRHGSPSRARTPAALQDSSSTASRSSPSTTSSSRRFPRQRASAPDGGRRCRQEGQGRGELLLQGAPEGRAGRHRLHPEGHRLVQQDLHQGSVEG